tara:strand:- start:682 stop:1014 length:333 start_codon:yes stop_codon:yes gene_type:complete
MATTVDDIIAAKDAENSQTTQYTSSNQKTIIDKFTGTNVSAGALTLSVNLVPSGGTAGTSNLIVDAKSIGVGETYTFPELVGHTLDSSDFISTIASATGVTIRASGRLVT